MSPWGNGQDSHLGVLAQGPVSYLTESHEGHLSIRPALPTPLFLWGDHEAGSVYAMSSTVFDSSWEAQ